MHRFLGWMVVILILSIFAVINIIRGLSNEDAAKIKESGYEATALSFNIGMLILYAVIFFNLYSKSSRKFSLWMIAVLLYFIWSIINTIRVLLGQHSEEVKQMGLEAFELPVGVASIIAGALIFFNLYSKAPQM